MSYDMLIIDPTTVPTDTYENFLAWFKEATEWKDDHDYYSIRKSTPAITQCFRELSASYPSLNDPDAVEEGDGDFEEDFDEELEDSLVDYSIGVDFLYVALPYSIAEEAYDVFRDTVHKHNLAFVDTSDSSTIFFPGKSTQGR